jgi:hypothetical protein
VDGRIFVIHNDSNSIVFQQIQFLLVGQIFFSCHKVKIVNPVFFGQILQFAMAITPAFDAFSGVVRPKQFHVDVSGFGNFFTLGCHFQIFTSFECARRHQLIVKIRFYQTQTTSRFPLKFLMGA